ncbi:DUF1549 and DUF1553 domain-containing protein [uncultured Gimesia sp.]|uniref:DUF1549 and DUF1553 domain-containing protein n=1 Tax=uncultured Gimesia sp. TaxID=1678688 RepID=UPI00262A29C1|nr:DUF1549 and DUF1553 domain-containing protein [uncultured Gimesia sp.]
MNACSTRFVFLSLLMFFGISNIVHSAERQTTLRVEPAALRLAGELDRVQLVVTSHITKHYSLDVTHQVKYRSQTPQVVSVSRSGRVTPLANGKAIIVVHSGQQSVNVPVVVTDVSVSRAVSFTEDVIPALTKAGCNQGACHGGQFGQGNFKLSLLGYAPEQDFHSIVRESMERRVSLLAPMESLLLKKASNAVPHGGGKRMDVESPEFQTLQAWIAGGAVTPTEKEARLVDIQISPHEHQYHADNTKQLRVIAHYNDGSQRDVTHRSRFDSLKSGIAEVTEEGLVTIKSQGQTAIMVRYRGLANISIVVQSFADNVDLREFVPANFVDQHVKSRWKKIGLKPSPVCSDEQFIRRAYLASIGTLPASERVESFIASNDKDKRNALIDELLGLTGDPKRDIYIEEWSAYWSQKWGDLLRNNRDQVGEIGMWAFAYWIRASLRENKPIDQFVREILLAQGSIYQNGQANFYKVSNNPTDLAETTAEVFLGVKLQCAKCHQHPFESYSQTDYYGMAAFFTRVTTKRSSDFGGFGNDTVVRLKSSGYIKHPRTGKIIPPTPLGQQPLDSVQSRDLRRPLAEWLTSPKNTLFAKNIVNRTWGYLMGVALVQPMDDMRATNPASNPELLDALAADFVKNGYDLRKLMRSIMRSKTFQLSSISTKENAGDSQFFSHYPTKRLPAEVLLDAIDVACGTQERFSGVPLGTRAIELPDPKFSSYFLDTLGRPQRIVSCECERTAEPNLAQVLQMANGELVQRKLSDKKGRIAKLVEKKVNDETAFKELYLTTLNRYPTKMDLKNCSTILASATDRRTGLEDILWALINGREFLFNH